MSRIFKGLGLFMTGTRFARVDRRAFLSGVAACAVAGATFAPLAAWAQQAGDDQAEWRGRGGARLINCGSWTYAAIFMDHSGSQNPYWPGVAAIVGPYGPPTLLRLLEGHTRADFVAARSSPA